MASFLACDSTSYSAIRSILLFFFFCEPDILQSSSPAWLWGGEEDLYPVGSHHQAAHPEGSALQPHPTTLYLGKLCHMLRVTQMEAFPGIYRPGPAVTKGLIPRQYSLSCTALMTCLRSQTEAGKPHPWLAISKIFMLQKDLFPNFMWNFVQQGLLRNQ